MMCALLFMKIYEQFGEMNERVGQRADRVLVFRFPWKVLNLLTNSSANLKYPHLFEYRYNAISKSLFDHRRGRTKLLMNLRGSPISVHATLRGCETL